MGQTLGVWGVARGPYLMLPLLGPSNGRDTVGQVGDYFINPLNNCCITQDERLGLFGVTAVSEREANIELIDDLRANSIDLYATIRTIYTQKRAADIRNGAAPTDNGGLRGHLQGRRRHRAVTLHQRRTTARTPASAPCHPPPGSPNGEQPPCFARLAWPELPRRLLVRLGRGQREAHRGTAEGRVLGPDAAAEMLDDLAADREAEPGALGLVLEQVPLPLTWRNFSKIASR